ncbi:polysaccharide biosynthesis tyrosine autokinase [Parvibium lacunae]|nr:polysaccharide biosynthesis tyrosine autokinase [Parvibium lacunae]
MSEHKDPFADSVPAAAADPFLDELNSLEVAALAAAPASLVTKDKALRNSTRMGDIFLFSQRLSPEQIEKIVQTQTQRGLRFGEAAIQLGMLTREEVEEVLATQFGYAGGSLLVGQADPTLAILHQPFSTEAEEIRRLRSNILLREATQDFIRLAVISAQRSEGKSYLAASLALALAQVGKRTLLIDADLRAPSQHRYFTLGSRDGLSSVLAGRTSLDEVLVQVLPELFVLPAGPMPPNPLEILRAPRLQALLHACRDRFDACIVDTHAAMSAADAQMVAHQVGQALLVGWRDHTTLQTLRQAYDDMQSAGVDIIGTIYNAFDQQRNRPLVRASRSMGARLQHAWQRLRRRRYPGSSIRG